MIHVESSCCKWFGLPVFTSYRDSLGGNPFMQAWTVCTQRKALKKSKKGFLPLEEVIDAIQGRKATEIRDHWFGIFGFLPPAWQEADKRSRAETWTTAEIFTKCSKLLYSETSDLTHIGRSRGQENCSIAELPTWAIDLHTNLSVGKDFGRWKLYNASGGVQYEGVRLWKDTRTSHLTVKALHIGSISACGGSVPDDALEDRDSTEMVRKFLNMWLELYCSAMPDADHDAFWRTIFMDTDVWIHYMAPRRGVLHEKRVRAIKQWWKNWNATKDSHDLTFDQKSGGKEHGHFHYRAMERNIDTTQFFVTTKGTPGMGPHDIQRSDEVYALAGCRALAVLRKVVIEGEDRLTFVGLCFLDQWMHGKATQNNPAWKTIELY